MWIIVGLGNPGSQYTGTRHNLGFDVVDDLARRVNMVFRAGPGEFHFAEGQINARNVVLIKPVTYMNNSGEAVGDAAERFGVPPKDILVVCDDIQLPLGTLRLRARGSDGGHNGLYSIIYHLQSEEFPRLRCGIAGDSLPREKSLLPTYVLESFTEAERPIVRDLTIRASGAVWYAVTRGIDEAMNRFNANTLS